MGARYIPASQLPDKSIKLIDTAAARVAISQHAVPAEVDDSRKRITALETEIDILNKESIVGMDHKNRLGEVHDSLKKEQERLTGLDKRWNEEKELVSKVVEIRGKLRAQALPVDDHAAAKEAIAAQKADAKAAAPAPA